VELSDEDVLPLSICFCMFFIMSFCMSEVEPDEELDDDEFEDVEFEDVEFEDVELHILKISVVHLGKTRAG